MTSLADRLVVVHDALEAAGLPHAFGGAIALAYCTEEPRATRDLDVNVFVPVARADDVLAALPSGVTIDESDRVGLARDGQVRVWWENVPIDLFLDVHDFHNEAALAVRDVPFEETTIPVLGCTTLVVFKAMFSRTKDWADIEAMLETGSVDGALALGWLQRLMGHEDDATGRLAGLLADRS